MPPPTLPRALLPALALALLSLLAASEKINGASFSTGHNSAEYREPYTEQSLRDLKKTGATWVNINAITRMNGLNAPEAVRVTDDDTIRYIVRKAKRFGFKVFLKPVVEVPGSWRGFLTGTPVWFSTIYHPFITQMARIAQEEAVEMFAIGSEYKYAEDKTDQWNIVITKVKQIYKGPITYVSNHDSFWTVKFWQRLDCIAISAYFVLLPDTYGYAPDLKRAKFLLAKKAEFVNKWREENGLGLKQVLIAEMGFQSKGNGVLYRVPYDWNVRAPLDLSEQKKMYQAFLSVFLRRAWVKGVLIWGWELRPDAGKTWPSIVDYTPQNKPALKVMKKYFHKYN